MRFVHILCIRILHLQYRTLRRLPSSSAYNTMLHQVTIRGQIWTSDFAGDAWIGKEDLLSMLCARLLVLLMEIGEMPLGYGC